LVVAAAGTEGGRVQGDESKLRQVLINLLGNAVKFTETGCVTLRVTAGDDDRFRFEVLDTGPGIAPDAQAEIFEPFSQGEAQAERSGTGLGLAISRRCIELMGGELALDSAPGRGSRFHFALTLPPLQEAHELLSGPDRYARLAKGHRVRALVVDDVRENREVLSTMLVAIGCETRAAGDGESAIATVRAWRPDIVFMDIWMPGLNGIEATTELLSIAPDTRFVAHSASAFDHEQKRYLEAGFDDFFAKPFRWERVCGCLEELLGVEFERRDDPGPDDSALPALALPEAVAAALLAATEVNSVTGIRTGLDAIAAMGPDGERVAERLREWMDRYEMDRIAAYVRGGAVVEATIP
jgi:CheY-like chemotaxis protein